MPFYQSKGTIPNKRHTVFKNPKGGIYYEELVSREGFSYMYSNLYHLNMPTEVMKLGGNTTDIPSYWSHDSYHEFIKYVEIVEESSTGNTTTSTTNNATNNAFLVILPLRTPTTTTTSTTTTPTPTPTVF